MGTIDLAVFERDMPKDEAAPGAGSGRMARVHCNTHTASCFRLVVSSSDAGAPADIQHALGQVTVLNHVREAQVFHRAAVVLLDRFLNQRVQEVLARVRTVLVLPLRRDPAVPRFLLPVVRQATRRCSTRSFVCSRRYQCCSGTDERWLIGSRLLMPTATPTARPGGGSG